MSTASSASYAGIGEAEYKRRIRAWTMYDWANSAFATTILAAVLPVYYSQVAGASLPSPAIATAYWSTGLSVSLFIVALLSPILGTISDVMRGKKRFLAVFVCVGVIATGLMILVSTGDWLLASLLFVFGRIGFTGANVFYDALLPHVAREEDQDRVSTRGYAMGYLGGGLLLAINIAMIQFLPGTWGPRVSFLSVALWWAVFSIPVFRRVPEPPAATADLGEVTSPLSAWVRVVGISFRRLRETFGDIRRYRELFKYLIAFLIYNDGIGTIIGVAAIYGAELGFDSVSLILALLLVQFVGIPFSLIFGRLPSPKETRRPFFLAFVLFNLIALPLTGILGAQLLPSDISGGPQTPYLPSAGVAGEGSVSPLDAVYQLEGEWETIQRSPEEVGGEEAVSYALSASQNDRMTLTFNGQEVELIYSSGPDRGILAVEMDGLPLEDADTGQALEIDTYHPTARYGLRTTFKAEVPGEHVLSLINTGRSNPESTGILCGISQATVLPPIRTSNLALILGMILAVEAIGLALAALLGRHLFQGLAQTLDTKRSILLALLVYSIIAIWGFFLDSVVEFWFLAWMVAIVQGGSQALSRSLYASLSPAAKSGEFFGLFGIMEKFSAILGPLIFAGAVAWFGSSRPAVLGIIAFFFLGGYLLTRVDVEKGRELAHAEDETYLQA